MSNVLLVEDSTSTRQIITDLLQKDGFVVKIARDGLEAIDILEKYSPDIVILDIVMPRMNGYELCRTIRANNKTKNVPIVICSAKGEKFDIYWAMKQGADAYIAKPFRPKELVGTIKNLLPQ